MIKQQLIQARDLIKHKQYDDARAILQTIDHPTAKEWLGKLNQLALSTPQSTRPDPDESAETGETRTPDTQQIKTRMLEARDFIMQKNYDAARAILEHIDHPTAQEWLGKLTMLITAQTAPENISTRPMPTPSENPLAAHDDILRQAQEALLKDHYDQARALLEPLQSPEAAFWLEKTGMTRFRTYENIWLDMFQYALPPKATLNPARWRCPTCKRTTEQALTCPQRDQNPCPVKISTRAIEEPRRLALLLQALYLDQQQDIEKIMIHIDPARLAHWKTELEWQLERMNPVDVRRAVVEEAIPLLEHYANSGLVKAQHAAAKQIAAQEAAAQKLTKQPPAPALKGMAITLNAKADATPKASPPENSSQPQVKVRASEQIDEPLLRQIVNAIIRFFINQAI